MAQRGKHATTVELANQFGRTGKLLGGRLAEQLADHGLSMPRFNVLVALMQHGPLRTNDLRSHVGITQGTASTLAEALVRDGLVERRADPDDRRASQLVITDDGRKRAEAWLRDYKRAAADVFRVLPAERRDELLASLRILAADHVADSPGQDPKRRP